MTPSQLTHNPREAAGFLTASRATAEGQTLCELIGDAVQYSIQRIGHGWQVSLFDERFRFLGFVPEPELS